MKLISQFKNKYNNITYNTYQLRNGMKVVHLDNPATVNFDFALIHKAGSAYEKEENVPNGTAHYLEHMLLNPNATFKTKDEINRFEQGGIDRPTIFINAFTNRKYIVFTGNGHQDGKKRIIERLGSIYQFPKKKFNSQLEKERGIILAEKSRKLKKENDNYLMSLDFLFKGIQDEFTGDVLGEVEDIKNISIDNLETYYKSKITFNNTVLSIQSNGEIDKETEKILEEISEKLPKIEVKKDRDIKLENRYRVGSFTDRRENGVSIAFIYFKKDTSKIDYNIRLREYLFAKLLDWLSFEILREKKSLIYSFAPFRNWNNSFEYILYGYKFTTEKEKIGLTIQEFYKVLYEESFKFLKTKKGKEWFEDALSTYIYPKTAVYDDTLAEGIATTVIENGEIFNYNKAVKQAKKIKIGEIREYLTNHLDIPPHIWIDGNISKKEVSNILKSSSFEKRFNTV